AFHGTAASRLSLRVRMKLERAVVLSQEELYEDTYLMWLSCPPVAKGAAPGRFLMVHCGEGYDPLLPRPMSFHRFREAANERQFAILYDVRGRGTSWLSTRKPGDELTNFGPLGRGYAVGQEAQNLLLVGGGLGIGKGVREARSRKPVQALLEERMGCGTGVCYGCAVFTRRGVRLVCKDGPRFELRRVFS